MSNYDYSTTSSIAGAAMGGLFAMIMVIVVICLAIAIVQIIGMWKVFKKADQPGWVSLIPIYNQYILCKVVGVNPWWILAVILSPILNIIPVLGSLLSMAISIYFLILLCVSTARSFGKDDGFAVGLALLAPVFYCILGFGDSKYLGAKPMNDVVLEKIKGNKTESTTTKTNDTTQNTDSKFCSSCGSKISNDTKFCPNCGSEIK